MLGHWFYCFCLFLSFLRVNFYFFFVHILDHCFICHLIIFHLRRKIRCPFVIKCHTLFLYRDSTEDIFVDMQTVDRIPLLKRPFKLLAATTARKDQASDSYDEKDIVTSCSEIVTEARNERRAAISLSVFSVSHAGNGRVFSGGLRRRLFACSSAFTSQRWMSNACGAGNVRAVNRIGS